MEYLNNNIKIKGYELGMQILHFKINDAFKFLLLLIIFISSLQFEAKADKIPIDSKEAASMLYDETPVQVTVEGINNFYTDIIYTNNNLLYVNIEGLFQTLKIPCITARNGNSFTGFIDTENQTYTIDYDNKQIQIGSKLINTQNGLLKESGRIYMESSLFADAFGLSMNFNFRALTINLKSNFELPIIKLQRLEKIQSNISKLKGELHADTLVGRKYHLFNMGTMDWSIGSNQSWKESTDNRFSIGIGTELLYGEADLTLNYYDRQTFNGKNLNYIWRWVDNDNKIIKQAQVGKIYNQSISFINEQIIGAVIRNTPTTVRKGKGYYTINDFTEPNWIVELYINNVLIDYTKSDASGLYVFKVPNVYGYTQLKLKFYGPSGEERSEERIMNIPYTIMPAREFEYGLSAGIVQDSSLSRLGRAEFNYGVNRFLTLGGGMEYLSSIPNGEMIPFAKFTAQPFSKLILNAEYAHGVKTMGLLNYYFTRDALIEIDYTKFVEGQLATRFNALEERKAKISMPIKIKNINGFARLDYEQRLYKTFNYSQSSLNISGFYNQFSANSVVQLNWIDQKSPFITTDLALSYRFDNGYTIRPSARFNITEGNFISYRAEIQKRISKGYILAVYERNVAYRDNYFSLNFKYDLPFARTSISTSYSHGNVSTSENAQGSLAFKAGNKKVFVNNNSSIGKGGILIYPFFDLNNNGIYDKGESMIKLTNVNVIGGGNAVYSENDSIVRIPNLNAFNKYMIVFKDNDLDNISWRFKKKVYEVLIDPNQFKKIEIPIVTVGEVSGMTYMNSDNALKGIGRILVKFYNKKNNKLVAETLSESDGYIYYLGLEPGEYRACIDSLQLKNLDLKVNISCRDFTIRTLVEGDIVESIDFILSNKQTFYTIQVASTKLYNDPSSIMKNLKLNTDLWVFESEGLFKYATGKYLTEVEAKAAKIQLGINGFVVAVDQSNLSETLTKGLPLSEKSSLANNKGMIYAIQVASNKTLSNPNSLKNSLNLSTDVWVFESESIYKYVTGKFATEEAAKSVKQELGIPGFVIAIDQSKIKNISNDKAILPFEKVKVPVENAVVRSSKGTIYAIQIASNKTYTDPITVKNKLKLNSDVWTFESNGMHKYVIGKYMTLEAAKASMIKQGIKGFAISVDLSKVNENLKLNQTEKPLLPVEKEQKAVSKDVIPSTSGTVYAIQVASTKLYSEPEIIKKNLKLNTDVWFFKRDGSYKYVTGKYTTKVLAEEAKLKMSIAGLIVAVDLSMVNEKPIEKVEMPVETVKDPIVNTVNQNTKGTIYTIQVASNKTYTDPVTIKNKLKLNSDVWTFESNGMHKYVIGKYMTLEAAKASMIKLRIKGFAIAIDSSIVNNKPELNPIEKPIVPIETEKKPVSNDIIPSIGGTVYAIQVASTKLYSEPEIIKKNLKLSTDVWFFQRDGLYKYVTGKYPTEELAREAKLKMALAGLIVAVDPSLVKEKPIEKAVTSEEKVQVPVEKAPVLNLNGKIYTIQLTSIKSFTDPVTIKKRFNLIQDVWFFEKDGMYKYVTGKYANKEEAKAAMSKLGVSGFVIEAEQKKEAVVPLVEKAIVPVGNVATHNEKIKIFTIQLTSMKNFVDPVSIKKRFNLSDEVFYFEKDGQYKFVTGKYSTKVAAKTAMANKSITGFIIEVDQSILKN